MNGSEFILWLLGAMTIFAASLIVILKNPLHALFSLFLSMLTSAGIYLLYASNFLATVQIIVYTSTIVFSFISVTTMVYKKNTSPTSVKIAIIKTSPFLLAAIFAALSSTSLTLLQDVSDFGKFDLMVFNDHSYQLTLLLFNTYLWPFMLALILIMATVLGAMMITRKTGEKLYQKVSSLES